MDQRSYVRPFRYSHVVASDRNNASQNREIRLSNVGRWRAEGVRESDLSQQKRQSNGWLVEAEASELLAPVRPPWRHPRLGLAA